MIINNYFLVAADDFKQALLRLEEDLSYILVPIQISAMNLSPIVDVFPYFKDEVNEPLPPHLKPIQTEEPVVNEEFEGESAVEENEQPEEADEE